jgi:hypothetical protein
VVVPVNHEAPARNSPIQKIPVNHRGRKILEMISAMRARNHPSAAMNVDPTIASVRLLSLPTAKADQNALLREAVTAILIAGTVHLHTLLKKMTGQNVPSRIKTKRIRAAHSDDPRHETVIAIQTEETVPLHILLKETTDQSVPFLTKMKSAHRKGPLHETVIAAVDHHHIRQSGMKDQNALTQTKMKKAPADLRKDLRITKLQNIQNLPHHPAADDSR